MRYAHLVSSVALAVLAAACVVEVRPLGLCDEPADCGGADVCDFPQGDACGHSGSLGLCVPRPEACPEYAAPTCGCDGRTYANPCIAQVAGVDVARAGACEDPCTESDAHAVGLCRYLLGYYWDGGVCYGLSGCRCVGVDCVDGFATREACDAAHATCAEPGACAVSEPCGAGEWCDFEESVACGRAGGRGLCREVPSACPPVIAPVCGCDGETYSSSCDANLAGTDVAYAGDCGVVSICGGLAGFACAATEWCDFAPDAVCGAADQTGVCRARPDACIAIYAPVCGCDGLTHGNECVANANGVDVAHSGACSDDRRCGDGEGVCAAAEWCDIAVGAECGSPGDCRPRPSACPEYYSPVCGCDGVTYDNPCFAQGSGTDTAYEGACGTPADCRTLGCPGTSHCDACLTATGVGWVCLPAGAVC